MKAYIEIVGAIYVWKYCELGNKELRDIGEFTRENILEWMDRQGDPRWLGVCPPKDFHAVCGDIDIPWSKEESREWFEK